jgi:hypothetical protein
VELAVEVHASAKQGRRTRSAKVHTLLLHGRIDPAMELDTPADLAKLEPQHILEAHLKPTFFRLDTNRHAPKRETAAGGLESIRVPYGPVAAKVALKWMQQAGAGAQ